MYILDYKAVSCQKLPKWEVKSRHGVYLGVSPSHLANVLLVLTLQTGHISPQYHVVFDEYFSTVESEKHKPETWDELVTYANQSWSQIDEFDDAELSRFEREEKERRQLDNILQQRKEKRGQNDDNPSRRTNGHKTDHGTINGTNNTANNNNIEVELHDNPDLHNNNDLLNNNSNEMIDVDGDDVASEGGYDDVASEGGNEVRRSTRNR